MNTVEYIDILKLKRHPKNPRKINEIKLDELGKSLLENPEFFKARPIIVDKNLIIWAGNSRFLAAKRVGLTQVPIIQLDLPKEKMQEIMIRDNVNQGEWDTNLLAEWDVNVLVDFGLNIEIEDFNISEDINSENTNSSKKKKKKCPKCGHEF